MIALLVSLAALLAALVARLLMRDGLARSVPSPPTSSWLLGHVAPLLKQDYHKQASRAGWEQASAGSHHLAGTLAGTPLDRRLPAGPAQVLAWANQFHGSGLFALRVLFTRMLVVVVDPALRGPMPCPPAATSAASLTG
jgi:hypothetical protein